LFKESSSNKRWINNKNLGCDDGCPQIRRI
jgi:hypothetical protein